MSKKFKIELEIERCWSCPFLNCSDVGENCNLLPYDFKKERDRWSNLNFINVEGISEDCPLIHKENMKKNSPVKVIK